VSALEDERAISAEVERCAGDTLNKLQAKIDRYETALAEIAKGEGAFSVNRLTHAGNCIEAMQKLATEALKEPA